MMRWRCIQSTDQINLLNYSARFVLELFFFNSKSCIESRISRLVITSPYCGNLIPRPEKYRKMFKTNYKLKFLALCIGMIVFHSAWAFFEEKLFRGRYGSEVQKDGEKGERFTFSVVFVAAQAIVFTAFAKGD